jgi:serpin B
MRKLLTSVAVATALVIGLASPPAKGGNVTKTEVAAVVKGNNEFAFDLYGQLRTCNGNLFFSPSSVSTALAMTWAGARGDTADEMARALHFTLPPDRLHLANSELLKEFNGAGRKRGYQLSVANALWGQKGEGFKNDYLKLTKDNYGGGLKEVNFLHDTEAARKEINAWVERQTQDRIKELFRPGVLDATARLVLTNAVYFKGDWNSRFNKDQTRDESFLLGNGDKAKTPLMQQTAKFRYHDAGSLQVLEMPYAGKELSMVVLLPRKIDGLAELEKSLTADKLAGWLSKAREEEVVVSLPKFKATSEFSLKDALTALGVKKAFTPMANFSGINGKEDLYVSAVVHKAFVDVNEEGTEAAAATGAGVVTLSLPAPKPAFRADHPFVFLIRDRRNDSVLFLGRIVNPTK